MPSRANSPGHYEQLVVRNGHIYRGLGALLAGALLPLALAPFALWPLSLAAPALLFFCVRGATAGQAAVRGWLFGVGRYGVGASWIFVSIHEHGQASVPLASFLVLLFVVLMALFDVARIVLWARLFDRGGATSPLASAAGFTACWMLVDWALTWLLTGFPWLYVGNAHLTTALAGYAPIGGVLLVSGAAVLCGVLLLLAVQAWQSSRRGAIVLVAAVIALWAVGTVLGQINWTATTGTRTVALIQGDIRQQDKWRADMVLPILRTYARLSEPHWGADLLIWPEAAITVSRSMAKPATDELAARANAAGSVLLTGMPDLAAEASYNGLVVIGGEPDAQPVVYHKKLLVPFGEYVPLAQVLRGLIGFFDLPMSFMTPGTGPRWLQAGDITVGPAICYEIAYPEHVRLAAAQSEVLVTVSNDTWFGKSHGPLQHLELAQMRALETGRFVLRATNNGVTAIIDERGRVTARLAQFEAATLAGQFQTLAGATPFVRWGILPAGAMCLLLVSFALVLQRRRADPDQPGS